MVGSVRIFMFEQSAVVLFADSGGEESSHEHTLVFATLYRFRWRHSGKVLLLLDGL